ncbi:colorectal mutant cancer protein [Leptopilina heterotoma]|uniref:colorectal mutant cancer protein n=1 Tax=Leptopilina heterotoma TaxID=63436 RepID=UPI001CA9C5B7|nr:colorectal mutant cancer protein [Leptopilina heterotoma]XP_043480974.1 colorectal mutant cancer protein [Leptopilina heterotoma]XP_043480975.1 colorectal mutant cancer protein [Leptopilina heterotoma]
MSQTADAESEAGSICDEERVRKLFQACDGDGDGFITSQDLLIVCRELNLENSVEELMRELGADEHGRISYQEFFRRRLALRPEIEALRRTSPQTHTSEYLPTSSDNSLGTVSGRHDNWEFDSGARDLSPEPHTLQKLVEAAAGANKLQIAALSSLRSEVTELNSRLLIANRAREAAETALIKAETLTARAEQRAEQQNIRHEERLTELHSVIAELGRQLERQRANIIAEEDESEIETSRDAEGSVTNPVDENEAFILGDGDRTSSCCEEVGRRLNEGREQLDSPADLPTPETTQQTVSYQNVAVAALQDEVIALRSEISSLHIQLAQYRNQSHGQCSAQPTCSDSPRRDFRTRGNLSSPEPLTAPCSPLLPPLQTAPISKSVTREDVPILKMAERVRLRRTDERHITGPDIANLGVCSTMVAEHLVSDLLEHSNLHEFNGSEKQFEVESERLNSRLEHARANNAVLALTLHESKAQCDRLSLLVGKYESNAIALRLALTYSDRMIEAYDVLVALLESELASSVDRRIDNRRVIENVAHVLNKLENDCSHLSAPWEDNLILSDGSEVTWSEDDEQRLKNHISRLKRDLSMVQSTVVEFESVHVEPLNSKHTISLAEARKLDLETAVLMQELMALREDKAELRARIFLLEKERATIEIKLNARDAQIQHLQAQLLIMGNKDRGLSVNESEGIESELLEALGREQRLKERLQELVSTLDKVNKNSELRHQPELVNDLKRANGALVQSLEKSKKKHQSRLKKMEQQMVTMVENHSAQVISLKQQITLLEEGKGSLHLQSQSSL